MMLIGFVMLAGRPGCRRGSVMEIEVRDPKRRWLDHHEGAHRLRNVKNVLASKSEFLTELMQESHASYTGL